MDSRLIRTGITAAVLGAFLLACTSLPVRNVKESERLAEQAREAYRRGNYDSAVEFAGRAIEANPDHAPAYLVRGNAYLRIADSSKNPMIETRAALADYNRALEIFPLYHDASFNRAMANASIGRYREAVSDLRRLTQGTELELRKLAHWKLAEILYEKYEGREGEALHHMKQYAELGGSEPSAMAMKRELEAKAGKADASSSGGANQPTAAEQEALRKFAEASRLRAAGESEKALRILAEILRDYPETKTARETVPTVLQEWE